MKLSAFLRGRTSLLVVCFLVTLASAPMPALAHEEEHASLASASLIVNPDAGASAGDPALIGQWAPPIDWPADAVHSILLHTGKVLWFRGDEPIPTTYTWDPATGELASQTLEAIIWCGGHSFLTDGRVLATGGASTQGADTGPRHAFIFDPLTAQWSRAPDMRMGRFYPTNTLLSDGRTLVFSGTDENGVTNEQVEAYVVGGGPGGGDVWNLLTGANKKIHYYPRMHVLPSGLVFHAGPDQITNTLDPSAQAWQVVGSSNYGKRTHGTSVMLPPGHERIMILGGRERLGSDPLATNTAEIIDLSQPAPIWSYTNPMTHRRMHANTVILPDGKVLVAGGASDENVTPVFPAEIFDPATNTWTVVASLNTFRGYHSSAVLLPDGRVLWAGSNGNSTAEIYSPPYLFRGARPVISSAPGSVQYGQTFSVQTPDAASVASVVFLRPGATTHSVNMEQRYVRATFTAGAGALDVVAPNEPNIAPPGHYMLFILNANGVPSVAKFVWIGGTPLGNLRPMVDAGLSQTITLPGSATLDGTVTDDGLPVPPGAVTTTWTKDSGPGTVTFADAIAVDTTATFSVSGTYVLRLTASDGELTGSDTVTIHAVDAGSGGIPVEIRVSSSSDDAEEKPTGSSVSLSSSDLELVFDGSIQTVGMRFNLLPVAQGTTILRAWVQFKVDEVNSEATSLTIQGQAVDTAPPFTSAIGNISSRARTTAAVPWSPVPWTTTGVAGPDQRTPDLSPVVQEVVDRPGWSHGNSLVVIITGTGHRTARAWDGDSAGAPLLHLELGTAPVNGPPSVNAGPDQTIRLPATASLNGTVADDGLPSPPGVVKTIWTKESGPGPVTFANPNAVDTTVSFSAPGTYFLELIADDGALTTADSVTIVVNDAIPDLVSADIRVASGSDDAEESATGGMSLTSSDLELVQDSSIQKVGIRFNGVPIPQGATIATAYVQFKADEAQSDPTSLTIQGAAADSAPTFTITRKDISSRARTAAAVPWSPAPWTTVGQAGPNQRTPDLSAVIQEIVSRPGWSSGNSLVLIITGTGHRTAEAYEGDAAGAALLHVEFH